MTPDRCPACGDPIPNTPTGWQDHRRGIDAARRAIAQADADALAEAAEAREPNPLRRTLGRIRRGAW